MEHLTRRSLLRTSGLALAAGILPRDAIAVSPPDDLVHLNLNENAFGPSPKVRPAIERELERISRYGTEKAAEELIEQIAAYERIDPNQVVLGEILGALGLSRKRRRIGRRICLFNSRVLGSDRFSISGRRDRGSRSTGREVRERSTRAGSEAKREDSRRLSDQPAQSNRNGERR